MMLSVAIPNSSEAMIRALEARVASLEKALQVSASHVVLQVGASRIALTTTGDINITGNRTILSSAGDVQIRAAGNLVLKATSIKQN